MSLNETPLTITANTSTEGQYKFIFNEPGEIIVGGVFGGAAIVFHAFTATNGREDAIVHQSITGPEAFGVSSRAVELVVTGATGTTAITVVGRPGRLA